MNELERLELRGNKIEKIDRSTEDEEDLENDPKRYSKYYLPSSGFGLLSRHNN